MKHLILAAFLLFISFGAFSQTDKYHRSFIEDFADSTSRYFGCGSTGNKTPFKYKLGVNSVTQAGSKILSFKIDPADSAGAGRGPEIISKDFTHFGSYAARLKIHAVKDIQPNVGLFYLSYG